MKLSEIGEFGLIRRFAPPFLEGLPHGVTGIGDDAAIIARSQTEALLVTTDMLVEGIHFLRDRIPARDLGEKSLAVNLSDIAAMGGTPTAAFLALGLPRDIAVEWIDEFFEGLRDLAAMESVPLLGGDTTRSGGPVIVTITVLGVVHPDHAKRRSAARAGDILCVTGDLGDSGGGLRVLLEGLPQGEDEAYLLRRHTRPRAHLQEGHWLGRQRGVHAMMDVSDGIDSDIRHIMEASACGARIDLERLPVSASLRSAAARHGWDLVETVMTSGEDYCLMLTVHAPAFERVAREFEREFGRPLAAIGSITATPGRLDLYRDGVEARYEGHGYDHFRGSGA